MLFLLITSCLGLTNPAPPDWWQGKRLFTSECGYIYASSTTAAREAEELVEKVRKHYQAASNRSPGKGLIIVSGAEDDLITDNLDELYGAVTRWSADLQLPGCNINRNPNAEERLKRLILQMQPYPLLSADLALLGCAEGPCSLVDWIVVVPTSEVISKNVDKVFRARFHIPDMDDRDMFMARLALLTMLFKASFMLEAKRDAALYAAMSMASGKTDQEVRARCLAYWTWRRSGPNRADWERYCKTLD